MALPYTRVTLHGYATSNFLPLQAALPSSSSLLPLFPPFRPSFLLGSGAEGVDHLRTMVRICLKSHFYWLNLSETLVTRSYGSIFPRVIERVSGAREGASEQAE